MSEVDKFLDSYETPKTSGQKPAAPAAKPASEVDSLMETAPPQDKGFLGHARDLGLSAVKSAIAVPETLVGLADIPTGGRVGKFLENEGGAIGFRPKQAKEFLGEFHTEAYKDQQRQFQQADGILDKTAVAVRNPSLIANTVTESVAPMLAGGVAARGLMAGTRLGQMGAKGAAAAGAIGEGTMMAGSQAEAIRQETEGGLLTPTQAGAAVATGLAGTLFGYLGGRVAQRFGFGDIDTMIARGANPQGVASEIASLPAKSVPRQVIEGAITEGFLEELPQSISEQVIQNLALGKPWSEGVEDAAVMGTLAGMAMGGGASLYSGMTRPEAPTGEVPPPAGPQGFTPTAERPVIDEAALGRAGVYPPAPAPIINERALEPAPTPSQQMGLDPAAGPMSAAAALAVDTGASATMQQAAQAVDPETGEILETGAKVPEQKQAAGTPEQMRERLGFIEQQARVNGGWDRRTIEERDRLQAELAKVEPAAEPPAAEAVEPAPAIDVSGRTDDQLRVLEKSGRDGWREAAVAEIQRRAAQQPAEAPAAAVEPAAQAAAEQQAPAPSIKDVLAKQIPDMTDGELQQAITHYGPTHKRTAKLQKEVQKRRQGAPEARDDLIERYAQADPFSDEEAALSDRLKDATRKEVGAKISAGEMPVFETGRDTFATITPSAQQPGMFQVTRYNRSGVMGDSQYRSVDDALAGEFFHQKRMIPQAEAEQRFAEALQAEAKYQARTQQPTQAPTAPEQSRPAPSPRSESAQQSDAIPPAASEGWDGMTAEQRAAVLTKPGGWSTAKGGLNVIGKKLAGQNWTKINPATRATIERLMQGEQTSNVPTAESVAQEKEEARGQEGAATGEGTGISVVAAQPAAAKFDSQSGTARTQAERDLWEKGAESERAESDVGVTAGTQVRFVPLADAVATVREAEQAGVPMTPFQVHQATGIRVGDAERVIREAQAPADATQPNESATTQPSTPEFTTLKDRDGKTVTVRTADLSSDRERMPMFTKDGKRKATWIHRDNLDQTGEKQAESAKEMAGNPLFNVITTKDGGAFAIKAAAQRELNARGLAETHEVVPAGDVQAGMKGYLVRKKAEAPAATHKDPGQPAEPVTQPVITEAIQKSARNTDFNPAEAKAWILGEIDKAIAAAPTADRIFDGVKIADKPATYAGVKTWSVDGPKDADGLTPSLNIEQAAGGGFAVVWGKSPDQAVRAPNLELAKEDAARIVKTGKFVVKGKAGNWQFDATVLDAKEFVSFDVPGDGKFKVVNTVEKLRDFRAKVEKSPGFAKNPDRPMNYGSGMAGSVSLDAEIKRIEGLSAADRRYQGGDVLEEIGNAIEIARLKKSKDEGKLLDRFKEASKGKDYDAWRAEQEAGEEAAARRPEQPAKRYAGPADVSSRAGQMQLANRAGTIASLKAMNAQLRTIAPEEAWADANIEDAADLDALRDQISVALVRANRSGSAEQDSPLRKRLEEASGAELRAVFDALGLAGGARMIQADRVKALMSEDAQAVSDALDDVQSDGEPAAVDAPAELPSDKFPVSLDVPSFIKAFPEFDGFGIAQVRMDGRGDLQGVVSDYALDSAVLQRYTTRDFLSAYLDGRVKAADEQTATSQPEVANQPALTGPRRNPVQVSAFTPYIAGDIVTIDGKDWQVQQDMGGWYLTSTGNWRGMHPTIQKIRGMNELIAEIERAATEQPDAAAEQGKTPADAVATAGDLLTPAQARALMTWEDLGQRDNVKSMRLAFFESAEDMAAKRGAMNYGTIESYQGGKWNIDGTTYPTLKAAKAAAEEAALVRLANDGYVAQPFAAYDAVARTYGYEVRADGAIGSEGKFPGPTIKEKGGRLRVESSKGDLLGSYPAAPESLGRFLESFWGAEKQVAQPAAEQPASDRDQFTVERVDEDQRQTLTFKRGETVKVSGKYPMETGQIDGISNARKEFRVGGAWLPFGYAYKAEYDEFAAPRRELEEMIANAEKRIADGAGFQRDGYPIRDAREHAKRYGLEGYDDTLNDLAKRGKAAFDRSLAEERARIAAAEQTDRERREAADAADAAKYAGPVKMTMDEWKRIGRDFKSFNGGNRTVMQDGRIRRVEIVKEKAEAPVDGGDRQPGDSDADVAFSATLPRDRNAVRIGITEKGLVRAMRVQFDGLAEITGKLLERGRAGKRGGVIVVGTADNAEIGRIVAERTGRKLDSTMRKFSSAGRINGFYDPKSGLTFLVGPNLNPVTATAVMLHEMMHGQQRQKIDARALEMVRNRHSLKDEDLRAFLDRVMLRMIAAGEVGNAAEASAYIVEQAVIEGRSAGYAFADNAFMQWVDAKIGKRVGDFLRSFAGMIRTWMLRNGLGAKAMTVDDFVGYAMAGLDRAAAGEVRGRASGSRMASMSDRDRVASEQAPNPAGDGMTWGAEPSHEREWAEFLKARKLEERDGKVFPIGMQSEMQRHAVDADFARDQEILSKVKVHARRLRDNNPSAEENRNAWYHGSKTPNLSTITTAEFGTAGFDNMTSGARGMFPAVYLTSNQDHAAVYGDYIYKIDLRGDNVETINAFATLQDAAEQYGMKTAQEYVDEIHEGNVYNAYDADADFDSAARRAKDAGKSIVIFDFGGIESRVDADNGNHPMGKVAVVLDESAISIREMLVNSVRAPMNEPPAPSVSGAAFSLFSRSVGDAPAQEAQRVQSAIEGKTLIEAAQFLTRSKDGAKAAVAQKVLEKLQRLEKAGVALDLKIVHRGDMAPASMVNARGYTETGFDAKGRDIVVWLNGADVTGKVGTEEEVLLHELVHAATAGMVFYGTQTPDSLASKHARDLMAVTDAIAEHIRRRFDAADAGKATLTKFEQDMREGANNAFRNDDEVLAWALSSGEAQAYLETIPYRSGSMWSSFVQAVRNLLGLSARNDTALSEVLRVADRILTDDAPNAGRAAFWHKRNIRMAQQQVRGSIAQTAERGEEDLQFSRSGMRALASRATTELNQTLTAPGKLSWWHKTIGTMYNLAERSPTFKPVFQAAQGFIDDVSHYAADAAERAPKLLPRLDTWRDILKSPISAEDNKAVGKPIFEGTLSWTRDAEGRPVRVDALTEAAAGMTVEEMAAELVSRGALEQRTLRMWRGMPDAQFESAIRTRYENSFLQPGIVWTDDELVSLFSLTPAQIALYREFRAAVDRSLDTMARADMLRFAGEDVRFLRNPVMEAETLREAASLIVMNLNEQANAKPDRAEQFMATSQGVMDRMEKVLKLQATGYAPLSRFGKYTVDVVVDGNREYFGLFETAREANKMAERMRAEFGTGTVTQGTLSDEAFRLFAGITPESLELFGNMLGLDSTGDEAQDRAFQEYLRLTKTNRSALRRLIHRKGIAGFSEDVSRVLASFAYSNARQTAAGLHMGDLSQAVSDIPKEQGELKDVAVKLSEYIKNPQEEAQAIRGLLFAQYLGGSVASAFVNMTQPAAVTFPWLSQHGGAKMAAAEIGKAAKHIATRGHRYEPDLAEALKAAEEDGVVSPQEVHQLMAQARGSGSLKAGDGTRAGNALAMASNSITRLSAAWGKLFSAAEQLNRRITFIAAYRVAKQKRMANPAEFARRAVTETQFVYSKASKMQWGRGAVGGTLMTFKTYSVAYMELMARLWSQGAPGSAERKSGRKAVALMLAMVLLMGGGGGLPFMEDAEDLIDGIAQIAGYNVSTKKARQQFLIDTFGADAADFIERGVSGLPGVPLDVSGRLGLGNLIPGTGIFLDRSNHTRDILELLGPVGDLGNRIVTGARKVLSGDVGGAALEVSPVAVRNVAKGVDMAVMDQYRDARGRKVLDTTDLEAALKAVGFQPASVAKVQDANYLNQRAKDFYSLSADRISAMWAAGIYEKDSDKVQKARDMIAQWNEDNPDQPMMIRMPNILRRVREMGKDKAQRIADTAPRAMRQQLREDLMRQ